MYLQQEINHLQKPYASEVRNYVKKYNMTLNMKNNPDKVV